MQKIIIISGTTATGKSKLASKISKLIPSIKISIDSKQVYKNIPIFSGLDKNEIEEKTELISFLNEGEKISAGIFKKKAEKIINRAYKENKIPILVGGSSFYIKSLIYQNFLPQVEINQKLRKKLNNLKKDELLKILKKKDKERYASIDKNNKPRIIRALEIIEKIGYVPKIEEKLKKYDIFYIWIHSEKEKRNKRIKENFLKRIDLGLISEAERLKKKIQKENNIEFIKDIFLYLGLSYKFIFNFWDNQITKKEFIELGIKEEQKYAKRQITYIKKFFNNLPTTVFKQKYNINDINFLEKIKKDLEKFIKK